MAYPWQPGGGGGMQQNSPPQSQQQIQPTSFGHMQSSNSTANDGQGLHPFPQRPSIGPHSITMPVGGADGMHVATAFNASGMPNTFSNDAELSALLSNYEPAALASIAARAQQQRQMREQNLSMLSHSSFMNSANMISGGGATDSVDPAAAAAAYGHLRFPQDVRDGQGRAMSVSSQGASMLDSIGSQTIPQSTSGSLWGQQQQQQRHKQTQSALQGGSSQMARVNATARPAAAFGSSGGYEGDASNSSSAQTPGVSSGEDSGNGKRRRATTGLEMLPELPTFGGNTAAFDQIVSSASGIHPAIPAPRRSSQDYPPRYHNSNAETLGNNLHIPGGSGHHAGHQSLSRPLLRHRRSHSGSQIDNTSSNPFVHHNDAAGGGGDPGDDQSNNYAFGNQALSFRSASSGTVHHPHPLPASGHAASHPPGLGNHALRSSTDVISTGGSNAATDFTKRKGWHTRIMDELLDFVHVLDAKGCVLFAASSVGTLTGWKLEELRGKPLEHFIHPHDVDSFKREFTRCFAERSEMTIYYRFRKKPQTADDKRRVHDQRIANKANQPQSESTSEGDSSSNQEMGRKNSTTFADGMFPGDGIANDDEDDEDDDNIAGFHDDRTDTYVLFEVVGHPYFSPDELHATNASNQASAAGEESQRLKNVNESSVRRRSSSSSKSPKRPVKKSLSAADVQKAVDANAMQAVGDKVPQGVQCFFCSGRVYPTKNVGMLDSFLELKLENERLRIQLNELNLNDGSTAVRGDGGSSDGGGRRSLDESHLAYPIEYPESLDGRPGSIDHGAATGDTSVGDNTSGKPTSAVVSTFGARRTSVQQKDASYSMSDGVDGEEQTTSPQATKLERSMTNNTAAASTLADDSDEALSPSLEADEAKRRKKKSKQQDEGDYVCTDCGRVDSPEWRKGPLGPKTLCNACGLRWAKKIKRSGGDPNAVSRAGAAAKAQQLAAQNAMEHETHRGGLPAATISQDPRGPPYGYGGGGDVGGPTQHNIDRAPLPLPMNATVGSMYPPQAGQFDAVMHPGQTPVMNFPMHHGDVAPAMDPNHSGVMPSIMPQQSGNFMFQQQQQQQQFYSSQRPGMPNSMMPMSGGGDGANEQLGGGVPNYQRMN